MQTDAGVDLSVATTAFLEHRRRQGRSAGTLRNYRDHFRAWAAWRAAQGLADGVGAVDLIELRAYAAYLTGRLRPQSVHNYVRSLRALWRWLVSEMDGAGAPLLRPDQHHLFAPGRIALPAIPRRERPAIGPEQLQALLIAAGDGDDELSARNRAILLLLWESGMRVHEVAGLALHQLDLAERTGIIVGKGDKQRPVFWGPRTAAALKAYLRLRRGPLAGPLFRGVSSRNPGGPITANLIRLCIKRIAARAGVTLPHGASVHSFRHGAAREWRRRGASRREVGELLGHDDPRVTDIYLGLDVEPRRRVHRRLYEPAGHAGRRREEG